MRGWGGAPVVRHYDVQSPLWQAAPKTIAVLSDLHICDPWSPLSALDQVIDQVMELEPDLILLPGDFLVRKLTFSRAVAAREIAECLSRVTAPLGVFASLGNHDWKDCPVGRETGYKTTSVTGALEGVGIPVLSNAAMDLGDFWLVGLDSQQGISTARKPDPRHDVDKAFRDVPPGASVVLMAHEPDIFLDDPRDVALQVSGHTHAGQFNLWGWRPATPSSHGGRLAYGLHIEAGRHLIVSAGLGYSGLPVRFMAQPEIVMIEIAQSGV